MQAPPSTSSILTYKDTTSELNRLKSVMTAKRTDWDTRTTIPGSRFFSPKHKLATAMSKVYGSLGELASAYGSPSVYDLRYHNFTKAEKALTSAKAESQLTLEDETQLKNYKSDVIFTVFASIATREEDSKIVDFEPCRTASEAYFGEFCSRVSGFLHKKIVHLTEEEKQARMTILDNALIASKVYITCANGLPTQIRLVPVLDGASLAPPEFLF